MIFALPAYPRPATLTLTNVGVARGTRELVTGLSAELDAGTLAILTGPNGVGKSSLLRAIAGFSRPRTGEVTINQVPVPTLARDSALPVAFHGHTDGLKPDLSVRANLEFYRRLHCRVAPPADVLDPIDALAEGFGLGAVLGLEVRQLSAGQRRRVALSRLLMAGQPIWILDEPYTNLDVGGRGALDTLIGAHLEAGGLCLIATHLEVDVPARRRLNIALAD